MQYVPLSKLREDATVSSVHTPYMALDTAGSDRFWLNLGCEIYNLRRWSFYCKDILQRLFGSSSKHCKYVNFEDGLDHLRSLLDTMVSNSYPGNQHMINNVAITEVFYKNSTITEYPIRYVFQKRKITADEKLYILEFLSRLNECLDFLMDNLNKIGTKQCSDARKAALRRINKMKNRLSKHNIVSDIEL